MKKYLTDLDQLYSKMMKKSIEVSIEEEIQFLKEKVSDLQHRVYNLEKITDNAIDSNVCNSGPIVYG